MNQIMTDQPTAPLVEDGVVMYTDELRTDSSAVAAVYLDTVTKNLYFQFHNGTVSRRVYEGTFQQLTEEIRRHDGSVGRFWNETADKFRGSITFYNIQEFALREDIVASTEANSLIVSLEINATWEDLGAVANALRNAGYSARIMAAQVNDVE